MTHEEHGWSTFDGIPIHAETWKPKGSARAVVALVHGLGDHAGRYPWLVEGLAAGGYAVSAFDRRGEGRSGGPRQHAPSYEALLKDIDQHLSNTRERFPGLKVVLYGHSFGGQQVLYYLLKRRPQVAAVVASSPALASGVKQPGIKVAAGRLMARLAPAMRFPVGAPRSSLSHDEAWVQKSMADPMFSEKISARLGILLLDTGEWILSQAEIPPVPLLLMQGTADQHSNPSVNLEFGKRLKGDVTVKAWDGLVHELHNEVKRAEVIAFARGWIDQHVK